jgi:MEDS: MEthanogen/methylotroph, DcmR Sensory domain
MTPNVKSLPVLQHPHAVRFYESDRSLAVIVAEFLHAGFTDNQPGIVVATPTQRAAVLRELHGRSLDVVELQRSQTLLMLDARDTLATFMIDGKPDEASFMDRMSEVIERACKGRSDCTLRIFGQMVDVLWQQDEHEAAIRLEMLWNQLAQTKSYSLLCGYAMGHFYKDADAKVDEVCAQHTQVDVDGPAAAAFARLLAHPSVSDA